MPAVIKAAKSYHQGEVEIIITDDQSVDGSVVFIEDLIASEKGILFRVVENRDKRGFSSNVNNGISYATGEIILLLNTDITPHLDFLSPLVKHFDDKNVFAVGCLEQSSHNGKIGNYGRAIGSFQRGFILHKAADLSSDHTFWVSCGSGAFRKAYWDRLGGLDQIYDPFYWEDVDISYRSVKSGYKILFEKDSIVKHHHEEGTIKANFSRQKITSIAYRNQFIFIWKNISDVLFLSQHIIWLPYHFISAFFRRDINFFNGFFKAIFLLPKIIQSRTIAKKTFVLSDKQVIEQQILS